MGDSPSAPEPVNQAAANREAIMTDIETLPQRLRTQQEAQLGTGAFQGLGREAELDQLLSLYAKSAPILAQQQLDLNAEFDPQRIAQARTNLQASDPTSFALHEQFNQQALNDLQLGSSLSADQIRNSQQSVRQAQTARGNYYGQNPAIEEAINQFDYGEKLKAQRQGIAAQALGLGGSNNQFASVTGAQQGATANNAIAPNLPFGVNAQAGPQGQALANQAYGQQVQAYGIASQSGNPWLSGLGTLAGLGSSLGGAAMLCWVAREVMPERWEEFRDYVLHKASDWFRNYYMERGQGMALYLQANPEHKDEIRLFMEDCLNG